MGVLEPRENAEKVGYPVVGEEIKEASNVIDYQINEEITKDASGIINANNQTTTGMATVIPGINAPKLMASTSITGLQDAEQEGSYYGTYVATGQTATVSIPSGETTDWLSYTMTQTSNSLPYSWTIKNGGVEFPRGGGYSIVIRYFTTGQEDYLRTDKVYLNDTVVDSTSSIWSSTDHTIQINVKKGDILKCMSTIYSSIPRTSTKSVSVRFTITPK